MGTKTSKRPRQTKKLREAADWYDRRLDLHQRAAQSARDLLERILKAKGFQFIAVVARVKERESFLQKSDKPKYRQPEKEIKDVVGIRAITYFESTARQIGDLLQEHFSIDRANSLDKSEALGADRVGYRSLHYIAEFPPARLAFPEFAEFTNIHIEIQVRSILQHAWAEIEHDRRFKYKGQLPSDLERRFSVLAGLLELADREFDDLASAVDQRAKRTAETAHGEKSQEPLSLVNITSYLTGILGEHVGSGLVEAYFGSEEREVLAELEDFGIQTLGNLVELLPRDFSTKHPALFARKSTFIGQLRNAMMLRDAQRYFAKAWKNRWLGIARTVIDGLGKQGVALGPFVDQHKLVILDSL